MSIRPLVFGTIALYAIPITHYIALKLYYGSLPIEHRFIRYPNMVLVFSGLGVAISGLAFLIVASPAELVALIEATTEPIQPATASENITQGLSNPDPLQPTISEDELSQDAALGFLTVFTHATVFTLGMTARKHT